MTETLFTVFDIEDVLVVSHGQVHAGTKLKQTDNH